MNKTDLQKLDELLKKRLAGFATKDDLKNELSQHATKEDLNHLEKRLQEKIDESTMQVIEVVDKNKADKMQVIALEKRVGILEKN